MCNGLVTDFARDLRSSLYHSMDRHFRKAAT
jgi:hypothetical protein